VTEAKRRLLWPSLMTALMLIVLLGLGTWQVRRLIWKEDLLAQIERAEASAPVPLPPLASLSGASPSTLSPLTPSLSPFMKVSATGTFLADSVALYGADVRTIASGPVMGARMIEPLREANGDVILVDRGWVPLSRSAPIDQPSGAFTVSGYIRSGDSASWFSAKDNLVERRFFTLDPKAIGAAIGLPNVPPFVLVVLGTQTGAGPTEEHWPDPARHLPRPPNSHLSYAITWYGLALALLAIFIVWARKGSRG
jgi:surfeit locus 1 family protein